MADHPSSSPTAPTSPPPRKRPRDPSPPSSPSPSASPSPAGYIFMCSGETKPECYARGVLGQPRGRLAAVSRIRRGAALFLYDFDARHLHGPYRAASHGGLDLAPAAFGGRFPAQVKFTIDGDFMPIPESSLRSAIKENYSNGKFSSELTLTQVENLRTLFRPIIVQPEPGLPHNFDDRHPARPAEYLPPSTSHPTQPATYVHHQTSYIPFLTALPCSMSPTAPSLACDRPHSLAEDDENGGPSGSSMSSPAGYIFMCNGVTKAECYRYRVMGLPLGSLDVVSRIRRGTVLFLYDFDAKHVYGPYHADSNGGPTLIPDAFQGHFPAQVKFTVDGDFMPIPESSLRTAIKENYSNGKFSPELTLVQVEKLRALFRPITVMPESALFHNDSNRHPVPPAVYLPPASHPSQPAAYGHQHHQTSYIPPSTAHPMPPESYAHSYAQMPRPNVQFTTPPYYTSTAEYTYQAAHTAYSSLSSAYQYAQAPPTQYLYDQQSLSDHVSATGYYTAPYYAPHQIGMHSVDPPRSHYLGSTSERTTYGTEHVAASTNLPPI
uniref:DCD domain-containing protein n=1 Tax=Oryza punctata TaxID=4537 RepID=A0A0E0MFW4_ORYPU